MNGDISYFLVVPPGAERWASLELTEHWPSAAGDLPHVDFFSGGLEFSAPLECLTHFHQKLRLPVRILVRIFKGPVHDWEELWEALDSVEWHQYFAGSFQPKLHISTRSSQLYHRQQLAKRTLQWFKKKFGDPSHLNADIYLRIFRDQLTVSLDATGEPLFKRGQKKDVGKAPLRENLAQLMLRMVTRGMSPDVLKNYQLVDPMAGSGTLILEGLGGMGISRSFAFSSWPCVKSSRQVLSAPKLSTPLFGSYLAFEMDKNQFTQLESNTSKLDRSEIALELQRADSLAVDPPPPRERILMVNPPFGGRVQRSSGPMKDLSRLLEVFQPRRAAFFIPESWDVHRNPTFLSGYKLMDLLVLDHGGLKVQIAVLDQPRTLLREPLGPVSANIAPN